MDYQKGKNQLLPSKGFNLCLQVAYNSLLLLREAPSGLNIMKYFSFKHKLQLLVEGLNAGALAINFQVML